MIALILFLGAILRIISINQSLWLDEATSATVVRDLSFTEIFAKFLPGDFHPPLYYLILKLWSTIFGYSEIALRMPSLIFGLATIYVTYLIGKKMFSQRVGLIASLLLATSGLHIYYSQEARMYCLAALLASALIYLFLKIIKEGSTKDWLAFSVVVSLAFLTDYIVMFVIPVLWIYAVVTKQKGKWWRKFILSHLVLLLSFLAWWPLFIKQLSAGLLVGTTSPLWWKVLGQTSFKSFALVPIKFILGRISFDDKLIYFLVAGFSLFSFSLVVVPTLKKITQTRLIWLWLIAPVLLVSIFSFWVPSLSYFRLLFCLPALYLLAAYGVSVVGGKYRNYIVILLLFINLISSCIYLFNPRFHREGWRQLVDYVENQRNENSIVVFVANSNMEAYRYYSPDAKIGGPESISGVHNEVFLMRYLKEVFDPEDGIRGQIETKGYKKEKEIDFNGVVVWEYKK